MAKKGKDQAKKKTDTALKTRLVFETDDKELSEDESVDEEFDEGGILLNKESVRIIFNALKEYTPTDKEEHLHGVLLEEFEETLVIEYGEPYPDTNGEGVDGGMINPPFWMVTTMVLGGAVEALDVCFPLFPIIYSFPIPSRQLLMEYILGIKDNVKLWSSLAFLLGKLLGKNEPSLPPDSVRYIRTCCGLLNQSLQA